MKRIKKSICLIVITLLIVLPSNVKAASGWYSINSNSSVTNGSNISVTFTINASKIVYWKNFVTYDTSRLQLISGPTLIEGTVMMNAAKNSISQTLTFKAKNTGNAWVKISPDTTDINKTENVNESVEGIVFSPASKTITVNAYVPKVYSTNNKLKSLSIDGYKLTPEFKNDVLEYSVELPEKTEKIKINATAEDTGATVSGAGEIKVIEGTNKIVVKVTAENGNIKEYIIKANVKELNPIYVTLGNKQYTVVRKKEQLPVPISSTYTLSSIKMDNEDIPAYKSDITKYTLIGLKDIDGLISLFVYDESKNTYIKYYEIKFNNLTVYPMNEKIELPSKYKTFFESINGTTVNVYKTDKKSNYSIFKGINIETGKTNIYIYEKTENTIQIYNMEKIDTRSNTSSIFLYSTIGLFALLILVLIIVLISLMKKNKKPKKIKLN